MLEKSFQGGEKKEIVRPKVIQLTSPEDLEVFSLALNKAFDPKGKETTRVSGVSPGYTFAIKEGKDIIAGGTIALDRKGEEDRPIGWLANSFVDEAHRGQGLAQLINRERENFARAAECRKVACYVDLDNPIGFVTKFNDGFVLTSISEDIEGEGDDVPGYACILEKNLDESDAKRVQTKEKPEWQEVGLLDAATMGRLLGQGWRGVDIKNKPGTDEKENNPVNWIMIFERAS